MMNRSFLSVAARALGVVALLCSMTACFSVHTYSPLKPPIRLDAPSGLQLLEPDIPSGPIVLCTVITVEGFVERVHGDTLWISGVQAGRQPKFAPACPEVQQALVIVSNHPDVQATSVRFSLANAGIATLAVIPALIVGSTVLIGGLLVLLL